MAVGQIARRTRSNLLPRVPASQVEWLELETTDAAARFIRLNSDLGRPFDSAGNGKRITCGNAYAGVGTAVAWAASCREPLGGAAKLSVDSFAVRWRGVRAGAPAEPCHYVSLGPGDGRKDGVLVADLSNVNRDLCYLPVDTSAELLHLAVRGMIRRLGLPTDRIMSLPWDFTLRDNLRALRTLLDDLFGSTPVLFSLLGNTIAHFDADTEVLGAITAELLRPGDRLLLEVEATATLSDRVAALAAEELALSPAFGDFVTSALRHHTGLDAEPAGVEVHATVERGRALLVKTLYRADEDFVLTLPNRATARFAFDDTIRLALSRKYTPEGLATMLDGAGLAVVGDVCTGVEGPFGLALLMLEVS